MIRRPPRSTRVRSSAASDVYKRQLIVADGTLLDQSLDIDVATLGEENLDTIQVNDLEFLAEWVLEPLQLGQAHMNRDLAALEADGNLITGFGALRSTAGGLALASLTTTNTGLSGFGSGRRTQVMQFKSHDQLTSSTLTK